MPTQTTQGHVRIAVMPRDALLTEGKAARRRQVAVMGSCPRRSTRLAATGPENSHFISPTHSKMRIRGAPIEAAEAPSRLAPASLYDGRKRASASHVSGRVQAKRGGVRSKRRPVASRQISALLWSAPSGHFCAGRPRYFPDLIDGNCDKGHL